MTEPTNALALPPEFTVASGNDATALHKRIVRLRRRMESDFLQLAAYLKLMRDSRAYEVLGYETFSAYLASPEISFDRTTVYRLIERLERFVIALQVPPERLALIPSSHQEEMLPYVGSLITADTVEEWLDKAEVLAVSDLKIELCEASGREYSRMCGYWCTYCTRKSRTINRAECLVCKDRI